MKSEFYIGGVSVIEFDEALLNARSLSELNLLLLFNGLSQSLKEAQGAIKASQLIKKADNGGINL